MGRWPAEAPAGHESAPPSRVPARPRRGSPAGAATPKLTRAECHSVGLSGYHASGHKPAANRSGKGQLPRPGEGPHAQVYRDSDPGVARDFASLNLNGG